jgi:hypothetical protein
MNTYNVRAIEILGERGPVVGFFPSCDNNLVNRRRAFLA